MSYLIDVKTNELVTRTSKKLKSGERVKVSFNRSKNALNADREWDLVNAIECKASNAKKWDTVPSYSYADHCVELNPNEFYI